jgi:hypothetical protein
MPVQELASSMYVRDEVQASTAQLVHPASINFIYTTPVPPSVPRNYNSHAQYSHPAIQFHVLPAITEPFFLYAPVQHGRSCTQALAVRWPRTHPCPGQCLVTPPPPPPHGVATWIPPHICTTPPTERTHLTASPPSCGHRVTHPPAAHRATPPPQSQVSRASSLITPTLPAGVTMRAASGILRSPRITCMLLVAVLFP